MPDIPRGNRPLSPHLQIYRPQWTSITSILTRITGNALIVSTVLVVWWLIAAATGPMPSPWPTGCCGAGSATSCCWGACGRCGTTRWRALRHLVWSTGRFMEIHRAETFGKIITAGSFVLTLLTVLVLWLL
jgi:succinate dehydrogenase / fumarate reductase cytochrome b subunit